MKVLIGGVHMKVSKRLRAYSEEHLVAPMLHFYDDEAASLDIHFVDSNGPKGGTDKECRVTLRIPGARALHVVEATDDFYKSVALVRDRLERMLKREKSKMRRGTNHRVGNPAGRLAPKRAFADTDYANAMEDSQQA